MKKLEIIFEEQIKELRKSFEANLKIGCALEMIEDIDELLMNLGMTQAEEGVYDGSTQMAVDDEFRQDYKDKPKSFISQLLQQREKKVVDDIIKIIENTPDLEIPCIRSEYDKTVISDLKAMAKMGGQSTKLLLAKTLQKYKERGLPEKLK